MFTDFFLFILQIKYDPDIFHPHWPSLRHKQMTECKIFLAELKCIKTCLLRSSLKEHPNTVSNERNFLLNQNKFVFMQSFIPLKKRKVNTSFLQSNVNYY